MSNVCAITMKITGEGRYLIKEVFDQSAVQTSYGYAWHLHGEVIRCDTEQGDGITVEPDAIVIKGETDWNLPLDLVQKMSQQHPNLSFEVQGTELTNLWSQRWNFEAGEGRLLDCVQDADNDEPRIDYMLNGEHFLPLPEWVSTIDEIEDESNKNPFNEELDHHGLDLEYERLETDNWESKRIDNAAHALFEELRRNGASLEQAIMEAERQRYRELRRWMDEVRFPGDVTPEWLAFGAPIPSAVFEKYGAVKPLDEQRNVNWTNDGF